jgi:hypothetical protein
VIFESARISSRLLLEDLELEPKWNAAPAVDRGAMYEVAR